MGRSSWSRIVASALRVTTAVARPLGVAAALLASAAVARSAESPWRALPSGLEERAIVAVPAADLPVHAFLVRLDPQRHVLHAVVARADDAAPDAPATPRVAPMIAARARALALVNASYFDDESRPLGLLVERGRRLSAANREGWAWVAVADGKLVIRSAAADVPARATDAVQAGPMLVSGGAARALTSPRASRRAFVGTDASGRIVLGATDGPLTLAALAKVLAAPVDAGGAGLTDALNLDGGSSTQLLVAGDEPELKVAGVPVPVFLGVFAKD